MNLQVRLYARAKDLAGSELVDLDVPDDARVADVRAALAKRYPALAPLVPSLLIAQGTEYADNEATIDPNVEVAGFPPVSGG